jgi:2'-5' RNA ligase
MRLFLAVWPDDSAHRRIVEVQDDLREAIDLQGVRFTRPDKIHLTLHFYRDVSERDLPDLSDRLSTVRFNSFEVRTTEVGAFPSIGRPKVVWLGLDGDGIHELQTSFAEAVNGLVPPPDRFSPHLTLARVKPGSKEVGRRLLPLAEKFAETPAVWRVEGVSLMESSPSGDYVEIRRFPSII